MRAYPLLLLVAGFLLTPCAVRPAHAQADPVSLTGLTAISVVVEDLPPVAERNGVTANGLKAETEKTLRQAGIAITPDSDAYLYVHVTIAESGASLPLPYFVEVSLMQEVTLPRNVRARTPIQCPTWVVNRLGMASTGQLRLAVTDRVAQFVDQFVKAYQSVNAK